MPPTSTSPNTPSSQRDRFVLTGTSGGIRRWRGPLVAVVTLTLSHLPQPAASPRYRIYCRSPRKIPRLNVIHFFSSLPPNSLSALQIFLPPNLCHPHASRLRSKTAKRVNPDRTSGSTHRDGPIGVKAYRKIRSGIHQFPDTHQKHREPRYKGGELKPLP
jgi:hypothetical protein